MCDKEHLMNCWETFYMQQLQQLGQLIGEQQPHKPNLLYVLGSIDRQIDTHQATA
jgi:hypothetical protein